MVVGTIIFSIIMAVIIFTLWLWITIYGIGFVGFGILSLGCSIIDLLYVLICCFILNIGIFDSIIVSVFICLVLGLFLYLTNQINLKSVLKASSFLLLCFLIFKTFTDALLHTSIFSLVLCIIFIIIMKVFFFLEDN